MPDVISCSLCSEKEGAFYFDIMGGSLVCENCKREEEKRHTEPENPHESHIIAYLSPSAKIALAYCVHSPLEKLFSFSIPEGDMDLFCKATELYLVNQLERSYKTLDFYKQVSGKIDL